jgi:hypothetical protein
MIYARKKSEKFMKISGELPLHEYIDCQSSPIAIIVGLRLKIAFSLCCPNQLAI